MSITNSRTRLTVVRPGLPPPLPQNGETVATFDDFLGWISSVKAIGMLAKFDESRMLVHRLESVGRPLPLALALPQSPKARKGVGKCQGQRRVAPCQGLFWIP